MTTRDVKPQNVLLFSNGYVKLGDLGCCVALPPGQLASTRSGTAAYMAPEVAAAQPYGAPADM
jgi:serine/threonine protein kinase